MCPLENLLCTVVFLFFPRVQWIITLKPEKTLMENYLYIQATQKCFILTFYTGVSKRRLWGVEGSRQRMKRSLKNKSHAYIPMK